MAPTVYLISGANRGIGLALVTQLAARENTVIFAGARNPDGAKDLHTLGDKHPGKVHVVQLSSANGSDAQAAVATVKELVGRLDVVIANAGMNNGYKTAADVSLDSMREHYEVNVLGPLVLFQATYPLLKLSEKPKFVLSATNAGSVEIGPTLPLPILTYGSSKAAAHWLVRKLHFECPALIVLPIHPGFVKTDMMDFGIDIYPELAALQLMTAEESATGFLQVLDAGVRADEGPKLTCWDGSVLPW